MEANEVNSSECPPRRRKSRYMILRQSTSKQYLSKTESDVRFSRQQAKYSQVLLQEDAGFLEVDEGEDLSSVTQEEIKKHVDIMSAVKGFDLSLEKFGPYRINYTRNGRHLLIGGRAGHLASFDWITKRLHCEINVMEEISDVTWLHQETMLAVAQKDWVYIYDNQGIELHCVKKLYRVIRMEFLPYHFLLVTSNDKGFLSWLDVSVGKLVSQTPTHKGRLNVMCQNPYNAVTVLGHASGTVTMWSPTVKEPLVSILCHSQSVRAVEVDITGHYMATVSADRYLKIWDVRMFRGLHSYRLPRSANHLTFSHRGLLALGMENVVQIYRDPCKLAVSSPYLSHCVRRTVTDMAFCPFEDVLGIGHDGGFSSILVPGAGEPNFDALEVNPYQTKSQRRETEVKYLLEKIQPEMIVLHPSQLNEVKSDVKSLEEVPLSKPKVQLPALKDKPKSKSVDKFKRKSIIKDTFNREFRKNVVKKLKRQEQIGISNLSSGHSALDRFKPKVLKSES